MISATGEFHPLRGVPPEGDETENLTLCCDDKKVFPAHPGTKVYY
jgi:hypothetical protein